MLAEDSVFEINLDAPDMGEAAVEFARLGYKVFPCVYSDKKPLTANGFKDATTDIDQIQGWWRMHGVANIGVATHELIVVDVDTDGEGHENAWPADPEQKRDLMNAGAITRTGRGGYHYYFRNTIKARISASKIAEHVDIRADGGYIIAPPSLHSNGNVYEWIKPLNVPAEQLPPPPAWLIEAIQASQRSEVVPVKPSLSIVHTSQHKPIPNGSRNSTLASLAGRLRNQGLSKEQILPQLTQVNKAHCTPPLPDAEVDSIAQSISRYPAGTSSSTTPFALTELGNAERFVAQHSENAKYCAELDKWLVWDGTCFQADNAQAMQLAKETVRSIPDEAKAVSLSTSIKSEDAIFLQKEIRKHAKRSETQRQLQSMLNLASTEPAVRVSVDELDQHPYLLNLMNGTLDLKTGQLREHRKSDLLTHCLQIVYDPTATAPTWGKFINDIMQSVTEMVDYLQRVLGYCITGATLEQCLFMFIGNGANGKSTLVEQAMKILGSLARKSEANIFTTAFGQGNAGNATPELARLRGCRMVVTSELDIGKRVDEARVKDLTGKDTIVARKLYQEPFEFAPTHKLIVFGNHRPIIKGTDHGIWRRLRIIPFNACFTPSTPGFDPKLDEKLQAELPGILNWMVQGCLDWQRHGLGTPKAVEEETDAYKEEMDPLGRFIDECCVLGADKQITNRVIYREYKQWAEANGEHVVSQKALANMLKEHGFTPYRDKSSRGWIGIGIDGHVIR